MDEFEFRSDGGSLATYLKIPDIAGESLTGYLKIPDIAGESLTDGVWMNDRIGNAREADARLPDIEVESRDGIWGTTGTLFDDPLQG